MINVVYIHNAEGNSYNVSLWEQNIVVNFKTYCKAKQFALQLAFYYKTYVKALGKFTYFPYTDDQYVYEDYSYA